MQINTTHILSKINSAPNKANYIKNNIVYRPKSFHFLVNTSLFKSRFFSELAVLICSGVDIKKALEIIICGITRKNEKQILKNILSTIVNGNPLSTALEKSDFFSVYDYYSIRIGEEGGSLSSVLKELTAYYSRKIIQQMQIRSALSYPILVLFTTVISLLFMLNYVVPMFEDVFMRFNGTLPALTKSIIILSDSLPKYFLFFSLLVIILIIIHIINKKKIWYRKAMSGILLKIPVAGNIISLTFKTRFCQMMKLLISSKVQLMESINLIRQMIGFYPLEYALGDIRTKLSIGIPLSEGMDAHDFFDKKIISMIMIAEEVNKLDIVFNQLYDQYSEELDVKIKTMNNLLEPILIIFVGGLVAIILISMYLPIFQMGTGIY